jgi:hypothetical protein
VALSTVILGELEGSIGTISYFKVPHFLEKKRKRENDKKILKYQFGRDD